MAKRQVKPKASPATQPSPPPAVDRAAVLKSLPADVVEKLAEAKKSDRFMVAIWNVADNKVNLFWNTQNFPRGDVDVAVKLLSDDLAKIR